MCHSLRNQVLVTGTRDVYAGKQSTLVPRLPAGFGIGLELPGLLDCMVLQEESMRCHHAMQASGTFHLIAADGTPLLAGRYRYICYQCHV